MAALRHAACAAAVCAVGSGTRWEVGKVRAELVPASNVHGHGEQTAFYKGFEMLLLAYEQFSCNCQAICLERGLYSHEKDLKIYSPHKHLLFGKSTCTT